MEPTELRKLMFETVKDKYFSSGDVEREINYCDIENWDHIFWDEESNWLGNDNIDTSIFSEIMLRYEKTKTECRMRLMLAMMEQHITPDDQMILVDDFMDTHFWKFYGIEKPRNNAHEWETSMCFWDVVFTRDN